MRVEFGHAHAKTRYLPISPLDYFYLLVDVASVKWCRYKSLNVHLPFEVQHPHIYRSTLFSRYFIFFGELLKKKFKINLFWENAPEENYGVWTLKYGQTNWTNVPSDIDLCLDIGHFSLGYPSYRKARQEMDLFLSERGLQIKHLHLHTNNLLEDQHITDVTKVEKDFSKTFISKLKKNRSYIYERGE